MTDTAAADAEFLMLMRSAIGASAERWRKARFNTDRCDRSAAEAALMDAYKAVGLREPRNIIWCDSPIAIERSRKYFWYRLQPGRPVKSDIIDRPLIAAMNAMHDLPHRTYRALMDGFTFPNNEMGAVQAIDTAVNAAAGKVRWSLASHARRLTGLAAGHPTCTPFSVSHWAPYELRSTLGLCHFIHQHFGRTSVISDAEPLWRLGTSIGWIVPHENICWVSERFAVCSTDAQGRLHNSTGPALAFSDGIAWHFWKNIAVPSWVIEHPRRITVGLVDVQRDPFIRRCMIDIMTPEAFIADGGAKRIASDATGTLWSKRWGGADIWSAVEVVNGTKNPDGTWSRYFLQVPGHFARPLDAVAWTYGMTPEHYARLEYRT